LTSLKSPVRLRVHSPTAEHLYRLQRSHFSVAYPERGKDSVIVSIVRTDPNGS
jgi:hypothetical protein